MWDLVSQAAIEPELLEFWECRVLATGPPGTSHQFTYICMSMYILYQTLFLYRLLQNIEYSPGTV